MTEKEFLFFLQTEYIIYSLCTQYRKQIYKHRITTRIARRVHIDVAHVEIRIRPYELILSLYYTVFVELKQTWRPPPITELHWFRVHYSHIIWPTTQRSKRNNLVYTSHPSVRIIWQLLLLCFLNPNRFIYSNAIGRFYLAAAMRLNVLRWETIGRIFQTEKKNNNIFPETEKYNNIMWYCWMRVPHLCITVVKKKKTTKRRTYTSGHIILITSQGRWYC